METVQDFVKFLSEHEVKCWSCGYDTRTVSIYPHDGGLWEFSPVGSAPRFNNRKVWASLSCTKCKYEYSFNKIDAKADLFPLRPEPVFISLESVDETSEKPWKGVCCKACWYAKGPIPTCVCRCGSVNHQRGRRMKTEEVIS